MYKLIYTAVFLLAALGASAQNMPERSEVRRGNRQYNKGNYEKGIERYERALEAAPESFEATYNLGNALYKAERFDKAEQTMRKAAADSLRADGERAEAFYNLGNAQFKQQKYKEALESYKQSLRLNPADQQARYNYAYHQAPVRRQQGRRRWRRTTTRTRTKTRTRICSNRAADRTNRTATGSRTTRAKRRYQEQRGGDQGTAGRPAAGSFAAGQGGRRRPGRAAAARSGRYPPQEQEQMLDAIQAQEDRTQEKLKEKQGVVVRGTKNW